jgi:hypothetical protein
MSEQVVPSAVAQCIMVTFLTNENVKPADILMRLRAQFGDETLSRTQVYDWSKSFKKAEHRLKRREDYNSARLVMSSIYWDFQGVLFIDFLTAINHQRSLLFEAS